MGHIQEIKERHQEPTTCHNLENLLEGSKSESIKAYDPNPIKSPYMEERTKYHPEGGEVDPLVAQKDDHRPISKTSTKWYASCSTPGCPCEASYNGQDNEACGKRCRIHGPCTRNQHYFPRELPEDDAPRQPHSHNKSNSKNTRRRTKDDIDRLTRQPKHCHPSKTKRKERGRA